MRSFPMESPSYKKKKMMKKKSGQRIAASALSSHLREPQKPVASGKPGLGQGEYYELVPGQVCCECGQKEGRNQSQKKHIAT